MPAGNETNNFVRDGSMLPHHDIDTSTTPNSWKPKCPTAVATDLCDVTLSGCESGSPVGIPLTDVLSAKKVCGVSTVEQKELTILTVNSLEPINVGETLEYNMSDPETGLTYTVVIRVTDGIIQHLDLTGGGLQGRFRPRTTTAEYTVHARMSSYGSIHNGSCMTRPHLLTFRIKDFDATTTASSTLEVINGTPIVIAGSNYVQSGNLFTAVVPSGNMGFDFEHTPEDAIDLVGAGYLNDTIGMNLWVHHYEPVEVELNCDGSFKSATDRFGNAVIETEVNY